MVSSTRMKPMITTMEVTPCMKSTPPTAKVPAEAAPTRRPGARVHHVVRVGLFVGLWAWLMALALSFPPGI